MQNKLCKTALRALVYVALPLLLYGCEAGDSAGDLQSLRSNSAAIDQGLPLPAKPAPRSCSKDDVNTWVYDSMRDYYLFYDQVDRNTRVSDYATPEQLIADLRVGPNDTFSYVTDETTYNAFFSEGETFGFGWNFARDDDNALLFSLIEPGSPLAEAGVMRGDQLVSINGISIDAFDRLPREERGNIVGNGDDIVTLDLVIARDNQPDRQVQVTKATFNLQTVLDARVIEQDGVNIGYLHFYQFINTSSDELSQAFATFDQAGVTELVIDLRFNGGGRIAVANELASYALGSERSQNIFTTFKFNDKYAEADFSIAFEAMQNSLSLSRVFVLQSSNTCSASELVVNSLRPFMTVVTIGSTSCGKPYATSPNTGCGKVANVLEIELLNADNAGGYFAGIAADCPVAEDVKAGLGQITEPLLSTALNYVNTGNCGAGLRRSIPNSYRLVDTFKPDWQGGNAL